jgi:nitroreductase
VCLYVNSSLQLGGADPDGRNLIVSCGAALNHCEVALAALGWRSVIHRLPDPAEPDLLAEIEVYSDDAYQPDEVVTALAAAIPQRRTDRRHYSSRPVSPGTLEVMAGRAARLGVMLHRFDAVTTLRAIAAQAARSHTGDHEYLAELAVWSGRYGSVAGIPARNIPEVDPAAPLPGRVFAGAALPQPPQALSADDNAVTVALGTVDDDRSARLQAGEATSAVLLTATALGLATSPISELLEIDATREAVRAHVFGASGYPQMLLRLGWAPADADPLPQTPRRRLDDVVTWPGGPAQS